MVDYRVGKELEKVFSKYNDFDKDYSSIINEILKFNKFKECIDCGKFSKCCSNWIYCNECYMGICCYEKCNDCYTTINLCHQHFIQKYLQNLPLYNNLNNPRVQNMFIPDKNGYIKDKKNVKCENCTQNSIHKYNRRQQQQQQRQQQQQQRQQQQQQRLPQMRQSSPSREICRGRCRGYFELTPERRSGILRYFCNENCYRNLLRRN
jgi:hypothetical protein